MFISTDEVAHRTGLSKATIWRYRQRYSDFPKPICVEDSTIVRWVTDEVDAWFLSRRVKG
jgi:predicted DNA-binding transcriptional regulator AlpA